MRLPQSLSKRRRLRLLLVRRVEGASMLPAFRQNSIVCAHGLFGRIQPGDIVILEHNNLEKIKRVEAVQDDAVFVLGDNATASTDSRSFGWLPLSAVQAKVVWPRR